MAMSQTVRGIAASFKSGKNQHRPLRDVTFELRAQAQGSSQKPRAMDASGCCIHPMISCYSRTLEIYALGVSPFLGGFTDQLRRKLFPSQDLCPDSVHCCSFGSNQLTRSWCSSPRSSIHHTLQSGPLWSPLGRVHDWCDRSSPRP